MVEHGINCVMNILLRCLEKQYYTCVLLNEGLARIYPKGTCQITMYWNLNICGVCTLNTCESDFLHQHYMHILFANLD